MSLTDVLVMRVVGALIDALPELSADVFVLLSDATDREKQRRLAADAAHATAQASVDAALAAAARIRA